MTIRSQGYFTINFDHPILIGYLQTASAGIGDGLDEYLPEFQILNTGESSIMPLCSPIDF